MEEKNHFWKGALCGALIVLVVGGALLIGVHYYQSGSAKSEKAVVSSEEEKKIEQLQELIDENYLHEDEMDKDALREGIYSGYIAALKDPYSVYYDKKATKELNETTSGEYGGIGAVLSLNAETGAVVINNVYKDSPAEKAGMKNDDILYKVEGKEVTGQSLSEVVAKVKGKKGTSVKLTVLRSGSKDEIELTAVRDTIVARTVEHEMKEDKIGYIRVTEFDSVTLEQYEAALNDLEEQGMKGLVVDLRSNPGGNLNTVCSMLDLMLPKGLIVYTEDKNGKKQTLSSDEEHQFTKPITVLVNGYSASASEIYAGAIQDYGLGEIVGTQTYGKGVVQQVFDLDDDTCVKLTIAEYFTPKGRNIDGKGITPDVEVEYMPDENNPEADNQLEKAMEVLKQKI